MLPPSTIPVKTAPLSTCTRLLEPAARLTAIPPWPTMVPAFVTVPYLPVIVTPVCPSILPPARLSTVPANARVTPWPAVPVPRIVPALVIVVRLPPPDTAVLSLPMPMAPVIVPPAWLVIVPMREKLTPAPRLDPPVITPAFTSDSGEFFAITATCARAESLGNTEATALADYFCKRARFKIKGLFDGIADNADKAGYQLAQEVLAGHCDWLENGVLKNLTQGTEIEFPPLPTVMAQLLADGGLVEHFKKHGGFNL